MASHNMEQEKRNLLDLYHRGLVSRNKVDKLIGFDPELKQQNQQNFAFAIGSSFTGTGGLGSFAQGHGVTVTGGRGSFVMGHDTVTNGRLYASLQDLQERQSLQAQRFQRARQSRLSQQEQQEQQARLSQL